MKEVNMLNTILPFVISKENTFNNPYHDMATICYEVATNKVSVPISVKDMFSYITMYQINLYTGRNFNIFKDYKAIQVDEEGYYVLLIPNVLNGKHYYVRMFK